MILTVKSIVVAMMIYSATMAINMPKTEVPVGKLIPKAEAPVAQFSKVEAVNYAYVQPATKLLVEEVSRPVVEVVPVVAKVEVAPIVAEVEVAPVVEITPVVAETEVIMINQDMTYEECAVKAFKRVYKLVNARLAKITINRLIDEI